MKVYFQLLALIITAVAIVGCSGKSVMIEGVSCESTTELQVACGIKNPEDLVYFSSTDEILFGQYGDMTQAELGKLSVLNPSTMATRDVGISYPSDLVTWGDERCEQLPAGEISPHGLDLSQRNDGKWQLLVVNHHQRESVEFFEVLTQQVQQQGQQTVAELLYRGCVAMPKENYINDVVATPNQQGFLVTHMMPPADTIGNHLAMLKMLLGMNTGYVVEWSPKNGFRQLPNSEGALPNGIVLAADGNSYFVNEYVGSKVNQLSVDSGELLNSWQVHHPDNSTWGDDGNLYVASALGKLTDAIECSPKPGFNCMLPFTVERIDPKTGEQQTIYSHTQAEIPVATVALPLNGALYLGTYSGDRLTKVLLK